MKAIIYNKKHSPHRLKLCELEKLVPKANEVLVKVVCVSLNAADYRSMKMGIIPKHKTFGSAVSGTIESVGENIRNFKSGDEVLADLADFGFGGLAEFALAPEKAFTPKLANSSFEDSATLPVAATTALKALRDLAKIKKGQQVLILGSSGGVGTYALQLAKYYGATVTAVCSTKNAKQSIALGADHVIDYTKNDFSKDPNRYDLILAINGNYPLLTCKRMLNSKGIYVMVGGSLSQIFKSIFFGWLLSFGGKKMKTLSAKSNAEDLAFVEKCLAEGKIKAVIHKRYTLDAAPEAMNDLSKGHSPAKVIINI